jgi:hypothetical protein
VGSKAEITAGASPEIRTKSLQSTKLIRKHKYQTAFTLAVTTWGKARRSAALYIHFLTPLELSVLGQTRLQFTLNLKQVIYSFTQFHRKVHRMNSPLVKAKNYSISFKNVQLFLKSKEVSI